MALKDWCILRTAGRNTIPLMETLNADGFTAWTPVEVQCIRERSSKRKIERRVPMTPSFVFARVSGEQAVLNTILALSSRHRKKQPDFSVMHYLGAIPTIADKSLHHLRSLEIKITPKDKKRLYAKGVRVRAPETAFAGMSGIVKKDNGKFALVAFDGRMEALIASFYLRPDEKEAA